MRVPRSRGQGLYQRAIMLLSVQLALSNQPMERTNNQLANNSLKKELKGNDRSLSNLL